MSHLQALLSQYSLQLDFSTGFYIAFAGKWKILLQQVLVGAQLIKLCKGIQEWGKIL